jgi:hypothetical protein
MTALRDTGWITSVTSKLTPALTGDITQQTPTAPPAYKARLCPGVITSRRDGHARG